MSDLINKIDEKTKLAGANKLEALTFSLGTDSITGRVEIFGINVFKVREVIRTPDITCAPGMPPSVKGMVSLRGNLIPVIDLAEYVGINSAESKEILILTEFNGKTQGFLVHAVDTILRMSWSDMKIPPAMIASQMKGLVTAVTELSEGRLMMMLDLERLLSELAPSDSAELAYSSIVPVNKESFVFFADDSSVARNQIKKTLEALNVKYSFAANGKDAWNMLVALAESAKEKNIETQSVISLILTDIEMPEMDGFSLTKLIKNDARFSGVPVFMHSSLSGIQNQQLGHSVGADGFISKFEPKRLADAIRQKIVEGK